MPPVQATLNIDANTPILKVVENMTTNLTPSDITTLTSNLHPSDPHNNNNNPIQLLARQNYIFGSSDPPEYGGNNNGGGGGVGCIQCNSEETDPSTGTSHTILIVVVIGVVVGVVVLASGGLIWLNKTRPDLLAKPLEFIRRRRGAETEKDDDVELQDRESGNYTMRGSH